MKNSILDTAKNFSKGEFDKTKDYLSENIVWNIVGEKILEGKNAVLENCEQTAAYFKAVDTDFRTTDILEAGNKVVITGTAEFLKDGNSLNFISACDIYEFNEVNEIVKIVTYCISEKTNK